MEVESPAPTLMTSQAPVERVPAHFAFVSSSPLNETDKEKLSQETEHELLQDVARNHPHLHLSILRWRASKPQIHAAARSNCCVLHFSGHCHWKKGLVIEETGQSNGKGAQKKFLGSDSLVEIFKGLGDKRPRVLFLAACHSKVVGQPVVEKGLVDYAIVCGEFQKLGDRGAPVFAKNFYQSLLSGKTSVSEAFESATNVLKEMAKERRETVISTFKRHFQSHTKKEEYEEIHSKLKKKAELYEYDIGWEMKEIRTKWYQRLHEWMKSEHIKENEKEEIERMRNDLEWAQYLEEESVKYMLLQKTKKGDVRFKFEEPDSLCSKTGWIPARPSFFCKALVEHEYLQIMNNYRLSLKSDDAVLERKFAKRWLQIVGEKGTGKTSLATEIAWLRRHDMDGPDAIFWVDLTEATEKTGFSELSPRRWTQNQRKERRILSTV